MFFRALVEPTLVLVLRYRVGFRQQSSTENKLCQGCLNG